MHIGIDDTDSTKGGCTTYIAARLVEIFSKMGIRFTDHPNIIRLNPNIPYKTRGNAALALRVDCRNDACDSVREAVISEIEQTSELGRAGTDPAVVFVKGQPTTEIKKFSRRATWDVLSEKEAIRIIRATGGLAAAYGARIGLVGALAAVGQTLLRDHTYELVAYRTKPNLGTPRRVDHDSVRRVSSVTGPDMFNSYDFENKRMLITPHGPDPVLLGIRGETPEAVRRAFSMVKIHEPVERWVIFRTNQGTDAHFLNIPEKTKVKPDRAVVVSGIVSGVPRRITGGHVFFTLRYWAGELNCAAFEPTGKFREIVAGLLPGDTVTVYGGAKKRSVDRSLTVNLEKIEIRHLIDKFVLENPPCPSCRKHMKSAGIGQGFRCAKCSIVSRNYRKLLVKRSRSVSPGTYAPALKAHRHLTKPLSRYGREKKRWDHDPPSGSWHHP